MSLHVTLDSLWWQSQVYRCFFFQLHYCWFSGPRLLETLVNRSSTLLWHRVVLHHTTCTGSIPDTKTPYQGQSQCCFEAKPGYSEHLNIRFTCPQSFIYRSPRSFWAGKETLLKSCAAYQDWRGVLGNASSPSIASLSYGLACGKNHYKARAGEAQKF